MIWYQYCAGYCNRKTQKYGHSCSLSVNSDWLWCLRRVMRPTQYGGDAVTFQHVMGRLPIYVYDVDDPWRVGTSWSEQLCPYFVHLTVAITLLTCNVITAGTGTLSHCLLLFFFIFTFWRFPSHTGLRRQWEVAIRREGFVVTESSKLCSEHFKPNDFDRTSQIVRLRDGAITSVFNFPCHLQE